MLSFRAGVVFSLLALAPSATADVMSKEGADRRAVAYLAVWSAEGRSACEARAAACEGMDLVLSRAASSLEAAGRNGEAIVVYQTLRDPRYHLERTTLAHEAAREIADLALTQGAFETTAQWLERFDLEQRERREEGAVAMARAVELRLKLGQLPQAKDDEARLATDYRDLRSTVAIAEYQLAHGDAEGAQELLVARISEAAHASLGSRLKLYSRLGRALRALGRSDEARRAYSEVVALARKNGPWPTPHKEGEAPKPRPAYSNDWNQEARDDAAEAFFELADARRRETAIPLQPYVGKGDKESVLAYITRVVTPWYAYETDRLHSLDVRFAWGLGSSAHAPPEPPPPRPPPPPPPIVGGMIGLLNTGAGGDPNAPTAPWGREEEEDTWPSGAPSPRWAVRTLATVGAMWSALGDSFRTVPYPKSQPSPEALELLKGSYYDSFGSVSDDLRAPAARAYVECLEIALGNQIADDSAEECEAWLVHNRKAEYRTTEGLKSFFVHHDEGGEPLPLPSALR